MLRILNFQILVVAEQEWVSKRKEGKEYGSDAKHVVKPLFEKRTRNFGIRADILPPGNLTR